ncbi:MAG: glycosyltransferase [Lentisphaeria bacterium]|nr:glycosyltransferase [Lentisphaeria bacterium]
MKSVLRCSLKKVAHFILPQKAYRFFQRCIWRLRGELYEEKSFARKFITSRKHSAAVLPFRISILCNVWNTPIPFLKQMTDSVLSQNCTEWELLINNCSDEEHKHTEEFLERFTHDPRVKIFRTVNQGICGNTHFLASNASGEFIFLMDHDDFLLPDTLERLAAAQQKEKSDFVYADEFVLIMAEDHLLKNIKKPFTMTALERENFINHPALIRKSLFEKSGGFRTGFEGSQDHDLYLRLCENTSRITYVPETLYVWRINNGSFSSLHPEICIESGRKAVQEHLERMNIQGKVVARDDLPIFTVVKNNTPFC